MQGFVGQTPMEELRWFLKLLNENNISYWIDNGTLLGLIREKQLLSSDKDIDISMWEKDAGQIHRISSAIISAGFQIRAYSYKGTLYAFSLIPQYAKSLLPINIGLFQQAYGYSYRHTSLLKGSSFKSQLVAKVDGGDSEDSKQAHSYNFVLKAGILILTSLGRLYFAFAYRTNLSKIEITSFPWKFIFDPKGTWWIPSSYFQSVIRMTIGDLEASIPKEWDAYLQFSYGNWRVPVEKWSFVSDDRRFQNKTVDELILSINGDPIHE